MTARRLSCLVLAAALLLGACGVGGGGGSDASPTTTAPKELGGKAVLAKLRHAVAYVETPIGSGSAVLTHDGYLVTNAHVVDPFDVADVTFDGEGPLLDVPVVGVDLDADIAVLGPVRGSRPEVAIDDPSGLDQGSTLFLVGYPGDQDDPQVTITSGLLSRRREVEEWGFHFLQSDAKIAPGQSGGALVDDRGEVIGISGLSDDDGYTLAFAGGDVDRAVDAIRAGKGSDWEPAPHRGREQEATFHLEGADDYRLAYFPAADEDRTVTVHVDGPDPVVELDDAGLYPLALNQAAADLGSITGSADDEGGIPDPTEPDADGGWTFTIDAGYPAVLFVGTRADRATAATLRSSIPFAVVAGDPRVRRLEADGHRVTGTLGYFDAQQVFSLDLAKGQQVDVRASSASGDVAYRLVPPGSTFRQADEVDGGGGGLFGADAEGTETAEAAGTYRLYVYQVEGVATGFHLTVG